jgi:hypothetical protein
LRRTFLDPQLDADFDEYGFVVVPFLDADGIAELTALYWEDGPAPDDPRTSIFFDFQSEATAFKVDRVAKMRPRLEPLLEGLVDDHHCFFPDYIMKWPGDRSGFAAHQDTTLVDESRFTSLTIWCPLADTGVVDGRDNGMLYVVPGSHRFAPWIRALEPGNFAFAGSEAAIVGEHGVGVAARAGEAIIFDHRLVHFSLPNQSDEARLVVALGLRPSEAQLLHFERQPDDGTFDVYAIDDAYFAELNPFLLRQGIPGYEKIGTVTAVRPTLSPEDFAHRCAQVGPGPVSARHRYVTDAARPQRVNADPFCFRCGSSEGLEDVEPGEQGNVQYLCPTCVG